MMSGKSVNGGDDKTGKIFDFIREEWVADLPEERVRQAWTFHLVSKLGYPKELIANEYCITVGKVSRRCDTVVFDKKQVPLLIIEYKAPEVKLSEAVVEQAFNYNSVLQVPLIMISNGRTARLFQIGYGATPTRELSQLPTYEELLTYIKSDNLPKR